MEVAFRCWKSIKDMVRILKPEESYLGHLMNEIEGKTLKDGGVEGR